MIQWHEGPFAVTQSRWIASPTGEGLENIRFGKWSFCRLMETAGKTRQCTEWECLKALLSAVCQSRLVKKIATYIARVLGRAIFYRVSIFEQGRMHSPHLHCTILRNPPSLERSSSAYKHTRTTQIHLSQDQSSSIQVSCSQSTNIYHARPNQKVQGRGSDC